MKVGIFYISTQRKAQDGRQLILLPNGGFVFIRVEEVEAENEGLALEMAYPREDETLMNTHALEAQ